MHQVIYRHFVTLSVFHTSEPNFQFLRRTLRGEIYPVQVRGTSNPGLQTPKKTGVPEKKPSCPPLGLHRDKTEIPKVIGRSPLQNFKKLKKVPPESPGEPLILKQVKTQS